MTPEAHAAELAKRGFTHLPLAAETMAWARSAAPIAAAEVNSPAQKAAWLRCAGTWFAGVDILPNDEDGAVGGTPLAGPVRACVAALKLDVTAWHKAQVSVLYPGYPRAMEGESEAAARFRLRRDAAHVDGLLPIGPARQRMLREPHGFILGVPLNSVPAMAGPLVVWEGSHHLIGKALADRLAPHPVTDWPDIDLTEVYQSARRAAFEQCPRVELPAQMGEATLLHRHVLHGMAPWPDKDVSALLSQTGRQIAYFRPELRNWADWI